MRRNCAENGRHPDDLERAERLLADHADITTEGDR
jgi:hypothetical protein